MSNIIIILLLLYAGTGLYICIEQILRTIRKLPVKPMKMRDYFTDSFKIDIEIVKYVGKQIWDFLVDCFTDSGKSNTVSQAVQPIQPAAVQVNHLLYQQHRMNYINVALAVAECIRDMNRYFGLSFCSEARNIYAPNIISRVAINPNGIAFLYETKAETPLFKTPNAVDDKKIQAFFQSNLPLEMNNGYYFNGPVFVTSVEDDKLTIEVQDVKRNYTYWDGNFYDGY